KDGNTWITWLKPDRYLFQSFEPTIEPGKQWYTKVYQTTDVFPEPPFKPNKVYFLLKEGPGTEYLSIYTELKEPKAYLNMEQQAEFMQRAITETRYSLWMDQSDYDWTVCMLDMIGRGDA
ncbi:MAG: hypothetical protein JSW41_04775, partial [Candidatus Aenigmatarchaeota archaeon]